MILVLLVLLAQAPVTLTNKTSSGHPERVTGAHARLRPPTTVPDAELTWLRANQYFAIPPEWLSGPTVSIYNPGPNWPLPPAQYPKHYRVPGGWNIPIVTYGGPYYPLLPIQVVQPVSHRIGSIRRR